MTELTSGVNALENPTAANAALSAAFADDKPVAPVLAPQPHGFVRLAGGLVRGLDASTVEYDAEVRELNGADEEYIDRVKQGAPHRFIEAVIERGTVSIGGRTADKTAIGQLLLGDAELLYTEIRRATFGEEIEFEGVQCPGCRERLDVAIEINDIPVARLEKSEDRFFEVVLRKGDKANCRLPSFADLSSDLANEELTDAERRTLLLSRTVLSLTKASGETVPVDAVSLGTADRVKIIEALGNRKVGPKYNEVKFTHEACGQEVPFPLAMGDLFPNL